MVIQKDTFFQDLETLEAVWQLTQDWDSHWTKWKTGRFVDLQTPEMEKLSDTTFKKLHKLSRELKVIFTVWKIVLTNEINIYLFSYGLCSNQT